MFIYACVNRIRYTLLVELLAIRLGEQTILTKSMVMAWPADGANRCRPLFPHLNASQHRDSAAPFLSLRAFSYLRARRFSTTC